MNHKFWWQYLPLFTTPGLAWPYLGGRALYRESRPDEYVDSAPLLDTKDPLLASRIIIAFLFLPSNWCRNNHSDKDFNKNFKC